jgi:hypothetical protein
MLTRSGKLLTEVSAVIARSPGQLMAFLLGKPATFLAVLLTLISAAALPNVITGSSPEATIDAITDTELREQKEKPPYLFSQEQVMGDNEIYVKAVYEWGSVESFEEETEVRVKAWNDIVMELEYERVEKTPDYVAFLKWKVEIEVESEVFLFVDSNGNGRFEADEDEVVMERKLLFNDIVWLMEPEKEKNTFVVTDVEGLVEATITIHRGITEPDGSGSNEPGGSFDFRIRPLCGEGSTYMALKVKAYFLYPDYDSEVVGYMVADCTEGMDLSWSFPAS